MIHKQERQANIISLLTKCKAGELKQATHVFLYELKVSFSQHVDSKSWTFNLPGHYHHGSCLEP
jgi:hypothetical protein